MEGAMVLNLCVRCTSILFFVIFCAGFVLVSSYAQGQEQAVTSETIPTDDMLLVSSLSAKTFFSSAAIPDEVSSSTTEALPDAPSAIASREVVATTSSWSTEGVYVAPKLTKRIPAGWTAQPLTPHEKLFLGLHELYSPVGIAGMVGAAGFSHLSNGQPNYGTNGGAFEQRLGAVLLRDTTEAVFADAVFAPLMHEDPRYYVQGPQHSLLYRIAYAATRPIITRTDSGSSTVNGSLLVGYAASSLLTNAYYPQSNRNVHDTLATFGGSVGGAAVGFFLSEFRDQVLQAVHLEKKQ
jgi:hypothetical protein